MYGIDPTLAALAVQLMQDDGIDASIYEDYSGRGMYGATTTGIVSPDAFTAAMYLGIAWAQTDDCAEMPTLRSDNMAMDTIIY